MSAILILYLLLMVAITIHAGVRSGRMVELLRTDMFSLGLRIAATVGIFTVCLAILFYLYAYYAVSSASVDNGQPRPLLLILSSALLLGLETGVAVGIPMGLVAITAQRITIWRMGDRVKKGHCYGCGYDLTGNESGICPECGAAISESTADTMTSDELSLKG
jgi:hypothetical protein